MMRLPEPTKLVPVLIVQNICMSPPIASECGERTKIVKMLLGETKGARRLSGVDARVTSEGCSKKFPKIKIK